MIKRKPKKVRKAKNKEFKLIVDIVHQALSRILSRRTKMTYQQELQLIAKTIQRFIETAYTPITKYKNDLLEQKFNFINMIEDEKKVQKNQSNLDIIEGLDLAVKILKGNKND